MTNRPSQPLRLLVIGAGRVAERYYSPALKNHPAFAVAAVVDPSTSQREWAQTQFAAPSYASTAEALSSSTSFDAALVLTPPRYQPEVITEVLNRGIAVLTEKPGARTSAEAQRLIDAASGRPLRLALARRYWRRYSDLAKRISGRPPQTWSVDIATDPTGWGHLDSSQSEGPEGLIDDLLPHAYDVAAAVLGLDVTQPTAAALDASSIALRFGDSGSIRISHSSAWQETVSWKEPSGQEQQLAISAAGASLSGIAGRAFIAAGFRRSEPVEAIATLLTDFASDLRSNTTNGDLIRLSKLTEQTRKLLNL